jgi:hypothetical protein
MTKRLVLDDGAFAELENAIAYYEEERAGLGGEFSEVVEAAFRALVTGQSDAVTVPGIPNKEGVRRILLDRFPFAIIHIDEPDALYIVAVAHLRRQPLYWRHRVWKRTT